jgi:hypothetical protein
LGLEKVAPSQTFAGQFPYPAKRELIRAQTGIKLANRESLSHEVRAPKEHQKESHRSVPSKSDKVGRSYRTTWPFVRRARRAIAADQVSTVRSAVIDGTKK